MNIPQNPEVPSFSYQEGIEEIEKDIIFIANAGTGKTHALTEHYFHLLSSGFEASQIVTFTFTEKAARELKERIYQRLPEHPEFRELPKEHLKEWRHKIETGFIGTLDEFCMKILKDSSKESVFNFQIIDQSTEFLLKQKSLWEVLHSVLHEKSPEALRLLHAYGIKNLEKLLKTRLDFLNYAEICPLLTIPDPAPWEAQLLQDLEALFHPIRTKIELEKEKRGWITFHDLEEKTVNLLKNDKLLNSSLLKKIRHILVDEFQDTSPLQIEMIQALRKLPSCPRVFCVGDPKQSIYRFRNVDQNLIAATESEILRNGGKKINLTQNYRSTPDLLDFINQFSQAAFPESLPSLPVLKNEPEPPIKLNFLDSSGEKKSSEEFRFLEASWIVQELLKLRENKKSLGDWAVLFRASSSALPLIEILRRNDIPYVVQGGRNLFEEQAIWDLTHFLRIFYRNQDSLALFGLLRSPWFLLSDAALWLISQHPTFEEGEYWPLNRIGLNRLKTAFPEDWNKALWAIQFFQKIRKKAPLMTAHSLIEETLEELDLPNLYLHAHQNEDILMSLEQFLHWLKNIELENHPLTPASVCDSLEKIYKEGLKKSPLGDQLGDENSLKLMTIHAAKGLQFEGVFLLDIHRLSPVNSPILMRCGEKFALKKFTENEEWEESSRFRAIKDYHRQEEEMETNRLVYVALTRARKALRICLRNESGSSTTIARSLMRFLGEQIQSYKVTLPVEERDCPELLTKLPIKNSINPTPALEPFLKQPKLWATVSELETFHSCSLKHHFLYQKNLSEMPWNIPGSDLGETEWGTLLHRALHLLHRTPGRLITDILQNLFIKEKLWHPNLDLNPWVEELQNYISSKLFEEITGAEEDYSELPFLLALNNFKIRGQIDRLVRHKNDWVLIDFKRSHSILSGEALLEKYDFQLKTYTLAAQRFLRGKIPRVQIHLINSLKFIEKNFTEEELSLHQSYLETIFIKWNGDSKIFPKKAHPACYTCSFREKIPVCFISKEPQDTSSEPL